MFNETVKLDWNTKKKYLKMVWFFRQNPHIATFLILGIKLAPHQRIAIKTAWFTPRCIWQFSRGMGKTFTESILIILLASLYHGYKIQTTAGGSFKQVEQTFDYMENIIRGDIIGQKPKNYVRKTLLKFDRVVSRTSTSLSIKLGSSSIKGVSIKGGNRGYRANTLTVGEANDLDRDTMQTILRPFLNVLYNPIDKIKQKYNIIPNKKDSSKRYYKNFLLLSGTISYDHTYYYTIVKDYLYRTSNSEEDYAILFFDFEDTFIGSQDITSPSNIIVKKQYYAMDINEIMSPLNEDGLSYEQWLAEQKNVPISSEGKFYPPALVYDSFKLKSGEDSRICPKFESDKPCFIGIDPTYGSAKNSKSSKTTAEFGVAVLELNDDYLYLIHSAGFKNLSYVEASKLILDYLNKFPNTIYIAIDARGGGIPIRDNLKSSSFSQVLLIDSTDPDSNMIIKSSLPYKDCLRLVTPTDEFNTIYNQKLKNLLQSRTLLLPFTNQGHFDFDRDNVIPQYSNHSDAEIEKLYKDIHILKSQLISIETELTANYLRFFVRTGNKDRYSALLYAVYAYSLWKTDYDKRKNKIIIPTGVWT